MSTIQDFFHMPSSLLRRSTVVTSWRLDPTLGVAASIQRGGQTRANPSDVRWVIDIQTTTFEEEEWRGWTAFFTEIGFQSNFTFFIPIRSFPAGKAAGIGVGQRGIRPKDWDLHNVTIEDLSDVLGPANSVAYLNAAAQEGDTQISLRGMAASETVSIDSNDFFSIQHGTSRAPMLYAATRHAPSDANGITHVRFQPGLRSSLAANTPVKFWEPRGVFQLATPFSITVEQALLASPTIQLIEMPEVVQEPFIERIAA